MSKRYDRRQMLAHGFVLGISGGLRSQVPLAMVSRALRTESGRFGRHRGWSWLQSDRIGRLLSLPLAGELFFDKLPGSPDRIQAGPLFGRIAIGALAGAAFASAASDNGQDTALTAAVASAGALVGSFAGFYARGRAVEASGQPDAVIALIEDLSALAIGSIAARP